MLLLFHVMINLHLELKSDFGEIINIKKKKIMCVTHM